MMTKWWPLTRNEGMPMMAAAIAANIPPKRQRHQKPMPVSRAKQSGRIGADADQRGVPHRKNARLSKQDREAIEGDNVDAAEIASDSMRLLGPIVGHQAQARSTTARTRDQGADGRERIIAWVRPLAFVRPSSDRWCRRRGRSAVTATPGSSGRRNRRRSILRNRIRR